jgi:Fe2+ or Zn2+ uptake regulation protein
MSTEEEPDIAEVADAIFNYLSEHTDEEDSLKVIAQWLKQHGYAIGLEHTRQALDYLKAVGLVIESPGRHGETLYKSAYASTGEI